MWKQERDQMQKVIFDKDEEFASLKEHLEKQKQQIDKVDQIKLKIKFLM